MSKGAPLCLKERQNTDYQPAILLSTQHVFS